MFHTTAFAAIFAVLVAIVNSAPTSTGSSATMFLSSAIENADGTATLPLYRGTSRGRTVYYVLFDTTSGRDAANLGINVASKLDNARGTAAVQRVTVDATTGLINFPASVDFTPEHIVTPGPTFFPPSQVQPGSVGEAGYSPLIQMPDGSIRNAPHVADGNGRLHDKVVRIDTVRLTVDLQMSEGFSNGRKVRYISTDSSDTTGAALEGSTYAPNLSAAPAAGDDSTASARASLAAFINGQTGPTNPNRQGLTSALKDGLSPLNLLFWTPNQGRYSPLWDVHLAQWSTSRVMANTNTPIKDRSTLAGLISKEAVTGPGGATFGPAGFIVNCPLVSSD